MFDARKYFSEKNDAVRQSYLDSLERIEEIEHNTRDAKDDAKYMKYFNRIAFNILTYARMEKGLSDDYFATKTADELAGENQWMFSEIKPENYQESYANPAYAVKVFGDKTGQLLSWFYIRYRQYSTYAFSHKIYMMERYNKLYLRAYEYFKAGDVEYDKAKEVLTSLEANPRHEDFAQMISEQVNPDFAFNRDIVEHSDLRDLRYLYKYGIHVSDDELETARFLQGYPDEKIKKLSAQIVKAYFDGFARDNKDISGKTTVRIAYSAGQERIVRQLITDFADKGLKSIITSPASKRANKQYDYDHRFDAALYMDEDFNKKQIENTEKAIEDCKDHMSATSGIVVMRNFGEKPFAPQPKPENLMMSPEQQQLSMKQQMAIQQNWNKYSSRAQTSFTAISMPSPQIGENFAQIFEDVLEINMLDSEVYDKLQKKIIDVLDKAEYVRVKGKGENKTDIKVKLKKLGDPSKETNFVNCLADINIPVGEVFTSPVLSETTGTLHVTETFLGGLKFKDLRLDFEDGYIKDYSCANFETENENRKYIHENLLQPHDTLPVGEFAIGTNTLAYVKARKHQIMDVLPVLIIEKMGPHFAIGDTCFAWNEDKPSYNSDGKEVVARDNERSALRKEDPQKAYTNKHTDITLPYDELEAITAITKDGEEIDVIRDGRFVVPGTEKLNEPLDEFSGK